MIEEAVRRARGLRNEMRVREANRLLNEVPESEEIWEAMKEIRESTPSVDGVKIR